MSDRLRVRVAAGLLIAVHLALGARDVARWSPTYDEAVNAASGFAFWKSGAYRVDAIRNNPLPRLIAGFPLLFLAPDPRLDDPAYAAGADFAYADGFLYRNRVPPDRLLAAARFGLFLCLSPLLALALFGWARKLGGDAAGLCALAFYALNPVLLSNAVLVNSDFAVTAFVFLSLRALAAAREPGARRGPLLALTGALAGAALASKHSAAFLAVLLPACCAADAALTGRRVDARGALGDVALAAAGALAALALIYRPSQLPLWWKGLSETLALTRAGGGHIAYLLGRTSTEGWRWYFPFALLVKTPLPLLAALAWAAVAAVRGELDARGKLLAFAVLPAAAWLAAACFSRLQIGVRYVLPVYPFLALIAGVAAASLPRGGRARAAGAAALLAWTAAIPFVHPDHLAYFNEAAGGPRAGYRLLSDSNVDWGQELKSLGAYLARRGGPPVYLSYMGNADPAAYGIKFVPVGAFGEIRRAGDAVEPFRAPPTLFAISATNRVSTYYVIPGLMDWLDAYEPVATIGDALFVYDFAGKPEALAVIARILALQGDAERARALDAWLRARPS